MHIPASVGVHRVDDQRYDRSCMQVTITSTDTPTSLTPTHCSFKVLRQLVQAAKQTVTGKESKEMDPKLVAAAKKLSKFALVVGVILSAAFFLRLPSSLKPNPDKEAKISASEYIAGIAGPAVFGLFGHEKNPKKIKKKVKCRTPARMVPLLAD